MPRPVPRRRAAPDAEEYAPRSRRAAPEDEPAEERRPSRSRSRGALPEPAPSRSRRAAPEPEDDEPPSRRGPAARARRQAAEPEPPARARRSRPAPEPEPEDDELPGSLREVKALADADFDALVAALELAEDATEDEVWDAVQSADEESRLDPEPPARSRRGRSSEPEEPSRGRRGRGRQADEDDESPARGRGRRSARQDEDDGDDDDEPQTARRGFQGFEKTRKESSSFADDFKLTEDEALAKFLPTVADAQHVKEELADRVGDLIGAEPFACYNEHGLFKELNDGQRIWPCIKPKTNCPICDTGHKPRPVALWNVVLIPEEGEPQLVVLKAGPKLQKILARKAALKTGPLDKEYYSLSQSAAKNDGPVEYSVDVVRERDLSDVDGWDTDPLTEDEIDAFIDKAYGFDFVKFPTKRAAQEVARKLLDTD